MSRSSTALKKTYNAVITARVVARDQLALFPSTAHQTHRDVSLHMVEFMVFVCAVGGDDLERIHTAEVTVPARSGDDEEAIVRRAAKAHGGMARHAWWEYDADADTPALANVVIEWEAKLPSSVPLSTYTGLATVPDADGLYMVLHGGDDYVG